MININQISFFPKWISNNAVIAYIAALALVMMVFSSRLMPWYYILSGVVAVFVFFLIGGQLSHDWGVSNVRSAKGFEKKIFWTSFIIRLVWVMLIYIIFQNTYGDAFGFENGDATYYNEMGMEFAKGWRDGNIIKVWNNAKNEIDISDLGYALYLGLIYAPTVDSILAARIMKCVWSAITVVLMYRLAKRNFGEGTARLTAIFCMLWPNFWYYCGAHLKESEMVFLGVLFVEQTDQMIRSRNFTIWKVVPILMISMALFTIRTPLALVTVLSLLFSVVMSSSRAGGWGKRIAIGILALSLIGVTIGNRIQEEAEDMLSQVQSGQQENNMEWRTERENGNSFAKYASKTVFAPLITTIPFPSMVRPFEGQDVQQLLNGGNFIKNILSFFTIVVLLIFLFSGRWRDHLVPLSYMLGYLVVLAMSTFAQSERFHQPAMPMEMMFAAYGIQQIIIGVPIVRGIGSRAQYKQWFVIWVIFMFIAAIAWNWFKLAGRGLA